MAFEKYWVWDNIQAQLDGWINNTQTTLTVKNWINPPANWVLKIMLTITKFNLDWTINKFEKVLLTNKSGNNLAVTRGCNGTTATTFDNDDYIFLNITAIVIQDLQDEVTRLETAKANDSAVVKLTGNQIIDGEKIFSQILKTRGNFVQGDETSWTGIFLNFWTPSSTQRQIDSYTNGVWYRDLLFNGGALKIDSAWAVLMNGYTYWKDRYFLKSSDETKTLEMWFWSFTWDHNIFWFWPQWWQAIKFYWQDIYFNTENVTGAWQSFTPTLAWDSWSGLTYYEQNWRYKRIWKTVFFEAVVKVNNKWTMAWSIYFQKPFEWVWYSYQRPLAWYVWTEGQPITSFKAFPSNYNSTTMFFKTMWSWYYNPLTWADISTLETFNIAGVYETP